jgi:molecular chaperone HscB
MDPFATLGIPRQFGVDLATVERTHRELSRALHPDRFVGAPPSERRVALAKAIEVNEAWRVVRDPIRRAEALLALADVAVGEDREPKADPEFLMEMLEQREALAEARQSRDLGAVRKMAAAIEARAAPPGATLERCARWPRPSRLGQRAWNVACRTASREARRPRSSGASASCVSTGVFSTR